MQQLPPTHPVLGIWFEMISNLVFPPLIYDLVKTLKFHTFRQQYKVLFS